MKKYLLLLTGIALMAIGCTKEPEPVDGGLVFDYKPSTQTAEVIGTLSPATYDWITMSQSGSTVTFTVKLNMTGGIRTATYSFANSTAKFSVTQKSGTSDAAMQVSVKGYDGNAFTVNVALNTTEPDFYSDWGIAYGKAADRSDAKQVSGSGKVSIGNNELKVTTGNNDQYTAWAYVKTTEGDIFWSGPTALIPAFLVKAGDDLQSVIDSTPEHAEIRVAGGAVFNGTIVIDEKNKNKVISGGWNEDFTEQSWNNLSVIDGGGTKRCIVVTKSRDVNLGDEERLDGSVEFSYFEIRNGFTDELHGGGLRVCGGPVTVHHCWFHHNLADRGAAFSTHEDNISSDITVYNCLITNNCSNGHAGAFSIEDGESRANPTKAVIVGNLIANNRAYKYDGYTGSIYLYQSVNVVLLNNTVVNTFNFFEDNGSHYPSFQTRQNTCALVANNMILRCWMAKRDESEVFIYNDPIRRGSVLACWYNNFIESVPVLPGEGDVVQDHQFFDAGFDIKTVLTNPDDKMVPYADLQNINAQFAYNKVSDFLGDNYMPVGAAVDAGTVGDWPYNSYDTAALGQNNHCNIKELLEKIGTDMNGNPFVKNGKVSVGCFAAK